jgi:hypothetical protein
VATTLQSTESFSTIDVWDAGSDTPTAEYLSTYHAVIVLSIRSFDDGELLGDVLAAYHDQGGGVVVTAASNTHGIKSGGDTLVCGLYAITTKYFI